MLLRHNHPVSHEKTRRRTRHVRRRRTRDHHTYQVDVAQQTPTTVSAAYLSGSVATYGADGGAPAGRLCLW